MKFYSCLEGNLIRTETCEYKMHFDQRQGETHSRMKLVPGWKSACEGTLNNKKSVNWSILRHILQQFELTVCTLQFAKQLAKWVQNCKEIYIEKGRKRKKLSKNCLKNCVMTFSQSCNFLVFCNYHKEIEETI